MQWRRRRQRGGGTSTGGAPKIWTILEHEGRNHLGLSCNLCHRLHRRWHRCWLRRRGWLRLRAVKLDCDHNHGLRVDDREVIRAIWCTGSRIAPQSEVITAFVFEDSPYFGGRMFPMWKRWAGKGDQQERRQERQGTNSERRVGCEVIRVSNV